MQLGLSTHRAPVYELANINKFRNAARRAAMINAREKAAAILGAMESNNNNTVTLLGLPIAVTDAHRDLQDDAVGSFLGKWRSVTTSRAVIRPKTEVNDGVEEPNHKRARTGTTTTTTRSAREKGKKGWSFSGLYWTALGFRLSAASKVHRYVMSFLMALWR